MSLNEKGPGPGAAGANPHQQFRPSLGDELNTVEQEARMVLPGIQTLFGFQMMAVFSAGFKSSLNPFEQMLHLASLFLVALSAILVVAPAAYHRQANHRISRHFVALSSRFLAWAMAPLAVGTSLDIYLVARAIVVRQDVALAFGGTILLIYLWAWFLFPKLRARRIRGLPEKSLSEAR